MIRKFDEKKNSVSLSKNIKPSFSSVNFSDNRPSFNTESALVQRVKKSQRQEDNLSKMVADESQISGKNLEASKILKVSKNLKLIHLGKEGIPLNASAVGNVVRSTTESSWIGGDSAADHTLKHYMVARNGTHYQFPVKRLNAPKRRGNKYIPDAGNENTTQGLKVEAFGGTVEPRDISAESTLQESRIRTLLSEYHEEGHPLSETPPSFNEESIIRSKIFVSDIPNFKSAGTISVVNVNEKDMIATQHGRPKTGFSSWGKAEMLGTIVIDCENLINSGDSSISLEELVARIREKIKIKHGDLMTRVFQSGTRPPNALGAFGDHSEILDELIEMVAEDVLTRRVEAQPIGQPQTTPPPSVRENSSDLSESGSATTGKETNQISDTEDAPQMDDEGVTHVGAKNTSQMDDEDVPDMNAGNETNRIGHQNKISEIEKAHKRLKKLKKGLIEKEKIKGRSKISKREKMRNILKRLLKK